MERNTEAVNFQRDYTQINQHVNHISILCLNSFYKLQFAPLVAFFSPGHEMCYGDFEMSVRIWLNDFYAANRSSKRDYRKSADRQITLMPANIACGIPCSERLRDRLYNFRYALSSYIGYITGSCAIYEITLISMRNTASRSLLSRDKTGSLSDIFIAAFKRSTLPLSGGEKLPPQLFRIQPILLSNGSEGYRS
jgi:hypothetical protein